jgi:hypothetical protein
MTEIKQMTCWFISIYIYYLHINLFTSSYGCTKTKQFNTIKLEKEIHKSLHYETWYHRSKKFVCFFGFLKADAMYTFNLDTAACRW